MWYGPPAAAAGDDDRDLFSSCHFTITLTHEITPVTQARIAEYFGVSDALITSRGGRKWGCDREDVVEAMKKRAEESHEE